MNYKFLAEDGNYYKARARALEHGKSVDIIPDFPASYDPVVKYGPEITGDPQYKTFFDSLKNK